MPIGMEVGLGPGDFVFDGDPATLEKGHTHPNPIFGPCLLWPNGCMDEDASWYGSRPRTRSQWDPAPREMGTVASLFSARVYYGHGRPSQLLLSSFVLRL